MDNLDLGCEQAAEQVLNRARDEALAMAALRSTLAANQAVATALTAPADRTAGKPRRIAAIALMETRLSPRRLGSPP